MRPLELHLSGDTAMPCNNQIDGRYNAKQVRDDIDEAIAKATRENRERREQFARSKYHR